MHYNMKQLCLLFLFITFSHLVMGQQRFYSLKLDTLDKSRKIDFSQFQNKPVLLFFSASEDSMVNQVYTKENAIEAAAKEGCI